MKLSPVEIAIIGGGPAGSLLAILLARRGCKPVVIERSPRFSEGSAAGGRSINLALAARGIAALRRAGIDGDIAPLLIPMRGRMVHDLDGAQRFLSYGQRPGEEINSVSRAALNTLLYRLAAERYGVEYRFEHRCVGFDPASNVPIVESAAGTAPLAAQVVLLRPTAPGRTSATRSRKVGSSAQPRSSSITATRSSRYRRRAPTAGSCSSRTRCTSGRAAASC